MKPASFGIGLRHRHYRELLDGARAIEPHLAPDFLEVHSENFFAEGGASLRVLEQARANFPISLHGVGLSLGSADAAQDPMSARHLDKLCGLAERIQPALISEHLCWGALEGMHLNDLLPFPYTEEALDLLVRRVEYVQEKLKRPILVENISSYLAFSASSMSETEFLAALAQRSGCGILLDINNLYVNAINFDFDAKACLQELPPAAIGQIHLAGHLVTEECLIDDHGSRVTPAVWALYEAAIAHLGSRPTLIEWDTDVPELDILLDEARLARQYSGTAMLLRKLSAQSPDQLAREQQPCLI